MFRYIELPRLRGVLTIAILLRFMDSLMIYTEPFVVTGGGPGNTTNFFSISLTKIAVGQFDLGRAAAYSLVFFFFIQIVLLRLLHGVEDGGRATHAIDHPRMATAARAMAIYFVAS